MRARVVMAVCATASMVAFTARADEITVHGNSYKNVLITKTASFYYIQFPDEGRTVSVPIAEAEASSVKINKDPFYRNPLRDTYSKNRAKRAAGEMKDVDPAFKAGKGDKLETAEPTGGGKKGGGGGAGGGGGGKGGFGVPRTAIEATLKNLGLQFQPGPGGNSVIAQQPGGSLELLGPPDMLTGIVAKGSGPAQQVDASLGRLKLLVGAQSPELAALFDKTYNDAKANGSGSGSAAGINISITRKTNGANVDAEIRMTAG